MEPYVKLAKKDWIRELDNYLSCDYDPNDGEYLPDSPEGQLIDDYVEWASKNYDGQEVPAASDLSSCYSCEGEFFDRQEELELCNLSEDTDEAWDAYCEEHKCIFWNSKFACLTDGYYENIPELKQKYS